MSGLAKDYKIDHYMFTETGAVFTLNELEDLYSSEDVSFDKYLNSVKFTEDFTKVYPKSIEASEDRPDDWYSYDDVFKALNKIVKSLNLLDWQIRDGEWFLIDLKHQKKNITSIVSDLIENVEDFCSGKRKLIFDECKMGR